MAQANWYVVHTYSGYENKVKANIEKTISNRNLEDQILEVNIPVEEVTEVTASGTYKQIQRKLFPGYVLVHMVLNDETWYIVRNTRGVTGFVGPGSKPVPLTAAEVGAYGLEGGLVTNEPKVIVSFEVDDLVVVTSGAWKDTEGKVVNVNAQKGTVTIKIELFGRETPVELQFADVKKK